MKPSNPGGFSLLECLIGLALSFFVVLACLGFFGAARRSYDRLKDREEAAQSALAALDKLTVDILRAGQGLARQAALGLVQPVTDDSGGLLITRAENGYVLTESIGAGDVRIPLARTSGLRPGREVCLSDDMKGEICVISTVAAGAVSVSSPLVGDYSRETASLVLLERIGLTLDAGQGVLRRRVNLSSAQPLLEKTRAAEFLLDRPANLVRVRFTLDREGDPTYELRLFPKNAALAGKG